MTRPYHPPAPHSYNQPGGPHPDYIKGHNGTWQGFGKPDFYLALIPSRLSRETIIKRHYSHRVVNNAYLHLGLYYKGEFSGVLVFGYMLNPARAGKVVAGTVQGEYLELNRMWLADKAPRNSESRAISYAIKYIKRALPMVAWIQSFADERCGRWGVVYQAANFQYIGSHKTAFYLLDGEYYHEMLLTAKITFKGRGQFLRDNVHRAEKCVFRQFRYIYFIKPHWSKRLNLKVQKYPKPPN